MKESVFLFFFVVFFSTNCSRYGRHRNRNRQGYGVSFVESTAMNPTISSHGDNERHHRQQQKHEENQQQQQQQQQILHSGRNDAMKAHHTNSNITVEVRVSITQHSLEPAKCKKVDGNNDNTNTNIIHNVNDPEGREEKEAQWAVTVYTIEDVMTKGSIKNEKDYPFHKIQYFSPLFDPLKTTSNSNDTSITFNSNSSKVDAMTTVNDQQMNDTHGRSMKDTVTMTNTFEANLYFYIPKQRDRKKDEQLKPWQSPQKLPSLSSTTPLHLQQQLQQYEHFINRDKFYQDPEQIIFIQLSKIIPQTSSSSSSPKKRKKNRRVIISRTVRRVQKGTTTGDDSSSNNNSLIVVNFDQKESITLKDCHEGNDRINNSGINSTSASISFSNNDSINHVNNYDDNTTIESMDTNRFSHPTSTSNQSMSTTGEVKNVKGRPIYSTKNSSQDEIVRDNSVDVELTNGNREIDTSTKDNEGTFMLLLLRMWIICLCLLVVILLSYIIHQNWDLVIELLLKRQLLSKRRDGPRTNETNGIEEEEVNNTVENVKRESEDYSRGIHNTTSNYYHTPSARTGRTIIIIDDSDEESEEEEEETIYQKNAGTNMGIPPIVKRKFSPNLFASSFDNQYDHQGCTTSISCSNTSMFGEKSQNEAVQTAYSPINNCPIDTSDRAQGRSLTVPQSCASEQDKSEDSFQTLNRASPKKHVALKDFGDQRNSQSLSHIVPSDSNNIASNEGQDVDGDQSGEDMDSKLVSAIQSGITAEKAIEAGSISSLGSKRNIRELHQDTPNTFESESSKVSSRHCERGKVMKRKYSRLSITRTRELKQMMISNNHTNKTISEEANCQDQNMAVDENSGSCKNTTSENADCNGSEVDNNNSLPDQKSSLNHNTKLHNMGQKGDNTPREDDAKDTNGDSHGNNALQEKKSVFSNGRKKPFIPPPPAPKFVPSSELLSASKAVQSPGWEFSSSISPTAKRSSTDKEDGQDYDKKPSQFSPSSNRRRTRSRTRASRSNRLLNSALSKRRDRIPRTIVVPSTSLSPGEDDGSSIHIKSKAKNHESPNKRKRNIGTGDSTSSKSSSSKRSRCY